MIIPRKPTYNFDANQFPLLFVTVIFIHANETKLEIRLNRKTTKIGHQFSLNRNPIKIVSCVTQSTFNYQFLSQFLSLPLSLYPSRPLASCFISNFFHSMRISFRNFTLKRTNTIEQAEEKNNTKTKNFEIFST